jgi:phthiocerol/phenolphthiocerol synthesis type-I polyketide synthase C
MVGIAALDWRRLAMLPLVARSPAFAALRMAGGQDDSSAGEDFAEFANRLAALPREEALALVTRRIADHVIKVTQADGELDPEKPIVEFGLDSLMAVELQMGLEKQFAVSLPMLDMHSLTIGGLAKKMLDALGARGEEATAPEAPPAPARSSEDAISDLLAAEIDRVKAKRETAAAQ